ncbi:MAG: glycosyltransferase family 2 protein [Solobacterium sp.]|nr:glycosyltransferase family 2 protein [Solobacterium sp.]
MEFINRCITVLFLLCCSYQFLFIPLSWFLKNDETEGETALHRFAVLICARNEEYVIGDLIDSIHEQTYAQDMLDIYVMADNCTDHTKETAEDKGAYVYTRTSVQTGKGYALQALLRHIHEDVPEGYDGYFVFDADNVLDHDFIKNMNREFSKGKDIITGYRASKNLGYNWISAGYGLWFLRESRYLNYVRDLLHTSCFVSGTGFLFGRQTAADIVDWPFHLLTEDIEFTAERILKNKKVYFCRDAVFYDEQPVVFSESVHQRKRWARGYLQVLGSYGKDLLKGMVQGRFACFDLVMSMMPAYIISVVSVFLNLCWLIFCFLTSADVQPVLISFLQFAGNMYLTLFVVGLITMISERKHIRIPFSRRILYTFTFPLFMFTYVPIAFSALFCRCEWTPVRHTFSMEKTG